MAISTEERRKRDRERHRAARKLNPDKNKAQCKRWNENNKEYLKEYRKQHYQENKVEIDRKNREWLMNNKDTPEYKRFLRDQHFKQEYGIGLEVVESMKADQNYLCAICKNKSDRLHVDHNHDTGKVREMLCHKCNTALGMFHENINTLEEAIRYLQKHN